ncbi:hypothetical protein G7Y79_00022g051620 [Physcia stellaris]|nr:hypothetical protein G7Y79_00022g051620 [Physcia stellaris]
MPEDINSGNVFSAANLSEYMYSSLTPSTEPQLRDPYDAVALLCHACMIAVGFRLIGLGEEDWNSTTTSNYAFRYAHSQSSLTYLVKVSRLGSKALVQGLTLPDEGKVHTLDFPQSDKATTSAKIRDIFISAGRITDLCALLKINLIQKLAPGIRKEGYEESAHAASNASPPSAAAGRERNDQRRPEHDPLRDDRLPPYAQPRPFDDPLAAGPRRQPYPAGDFPPPGFEDEYEIHRPPGGGPFGGARRPLNIGERDLYPPGLGPRDPLRGPGGYGPGGGGMHPTFDDPMFGGGGGGEGGFGGFGGRAPPGARYDPVGPGDGIPRGGMGRFPGSGGGGFGGGGMGGPFGGDII